jgi:recombinase
VGSLAYLLKNQFYIGEVVYRGKVHRGEHEPILERDLFEAVQAKLSSNAVARQVRLKGSPAILTGRIFDRSRRGSTRPRMTTHPIIEPIELANYRGQAGACVPSGIDGLAQRGRHDSGVAHGGQPAKSGRQAVASLRHPRSSVRRRIASNSGIAGHSNDQGRGAARRSGAWSACLDATRVCARGLIEPVVKADFCFATSFVAICCRNSCCSACKAAIAITICWFMAF